MTEKNGTVEPRSVYRNEQTQKKPEKNHNWLKFLLNCELLVR